MKTSNLPPDHQRCLEQRPFQFGCVTDIFPVDELHVLSEHGNWLTALANGMLQPVNDEQEHFLRVDREEAEPETVWERAWIRLKGRREFEREQAMVSAPPPPEDYGIIEWDKERCWW
jgi:uncharacterized protein YifE (UPF0438 family)